MDKECRDLRRKEQRTPKKPKKPPSLNEEFEEDDKENQEAGGVGQEDGAKKELFSQTNSPILSTRRSQIRTGTSTGRICQLSREFARLKT